VDEGGYVMDARLKNTLIEIARSDQHLTVLSGSGVSSESEIPTFRKPGNSWIIDGKEYPSYELATRKMFEKNPDDVWRWYLYGRGICRRANPNPGHRSLVEIERLFPERFTLITQSTDNLHLRAGSSVKNTFEVHGNLFYMRCFNDCNSAIYPIPEGVSDKTRNDELTEAERRLLSCPVCGGPARPHVLWLDETYNEEYYSYLSVLRIARKTRLLIVVGTSGSTNLPVLIAQTVQRRGGIIIDINIHETPFSYMADATGGYFIQETSSVALPAIYKALNEALIY
jgi:NAD-dependent deacetylase